MICKFCLDDHNQSDIITPCLCRGSVGHVHRSCLEYWRELNARNNSMCELCKYVYDVDLNHWIPPHVYVSYWWQGNKATIKHMFRVLYKLFAKHALFYSVCFAVPPLFFCTPPSTSIVYVLRLLWFELQIKGIIRDWRNDDWFGLVVVHSFISYIAVAFVTPIVVFMSTVCFVHIVAILISIYNVYPRNLAAIRPPARLAI